MQKLLKHILNSRTERNISLLLLNFIYVFVWGITTGKIEVYGYGLIYSLIFVFAIRTIKSHSLRLFYFSALAIVIFWFSFFMNYSQIMLISYIISIVFFIYVLVFTVVNLAKAKVISTVEFLEAVNIYFFLGIIGSILFSIVFKINPDAFFSVQQLSAPADLIYFSFVTLTSLGYGDISPTSPMTKSIAIFLSFSGQIYIAFIVSMLVGKYLNTNYKV